MLDKSKSYHAEFLSEINFLLTREDHFGSLIEVLNPIKSLFLEEEELLSFSLARYSGASAKLAFFCEWYRIQFLITLNNKTLFRHNQEYYRKKVPVKLRGVPNLYKIIDTHIESHFLPFQLSFLNTKSRELVYDLTEKYTYLSKYLNSEYFSQFQISEITTINKLYNENITVSQFFEAQGYRSSYITIGFPTLISIYYNFNQPDSPINPSKIKWVLLEEILRYVAIMHQTAQSHELQEFVYSSRLSDKDQFEWWQLEPEFKLKTAMSDTAARETVKELRQKVYNGAKSNLKAITLPDKYKEMLLDLIEWGYSVEDE